MAEARNWRKIFSFSKRDNATHTWWEAQENPSVSLQLLIREDIERNGFSDKLNAPVVQQPRRGRPPKDEGEPQEQYDFEIHDAESVPVVERRRQPVEPAEPETSKEPETRTVSSVNQTPATPKQSPRAQAAPRRREPEQEQPKHDHHGNTEDASVADSDSILMRL